MNNHEDSVKGYVMKSRKRRRKGTQYAFHIQ